ncbi:hypothetical protein FRB95_012125 [Tulasnella sp. JGI-2019a]|nr:hypothetical protein FRB95_012125 [Tulasnella sp. JGI-2019a]
MLPKDMPEKTDEFGEKKDYWFRYDSLADSKDKVMIDRLNSDLDVLIFAGLFSAVNTAFIVLTLASLSAPPSYRTEALLTLLVMQVGNSTLTSNDLSPSFSPSPAAIRQNSTFFASLCASILAAAGAMLAKQWLQSYQRTGQTGSRRKQALLRTQKWMGAESWGLRPVVEVLPTLLLVSLALFFAALCDFLWSTSQPVAIVVLAFTAMGAMFYGLTVIAAAIDTFCPYQTAVSRVIRQLVQRPFLSKSSLWSGTAGRLQARYPSIIGMVERISIAKRGAWNFFRGDTLMQDVAGLGREVWKFFGEEDLFRQMMQSSPKSDAEETVDETICAHSILWMLENATEEEDILACAEHIPTLASLSSIWMISQSPPFLTLIQRFDAAVTDLHNGKGSEQSALTFGRAVTHVVIADPMHSAEAVALRLNASGPTRVESLYGDLWALCASADLVRSAIGPGTETVFFDLIFAKEGKVFRDIEEYISDRTTAVISSFQASTTLAFCSVLSLSRYGIPLYLVDPCAVHQHSIINILCLEIIDLAKGSRRLLDQRVRDVWQARNGENVVGHIMDTIEAHDQQISKGVDRRGLLRYHTEVLRYCRSARGLGYSGDSEIHTHAIRQHLSHVIIHCRVASNDSIPATEVGEVRKLLGWEERLSEDPLIQAEALQLELMAYATQLLLCLVSLLPADHRIWHPWFTSEEVETLVDSVAKLQARFVADVDVLHALKVIDFAVLEQPVTLNNLAQRFNSISPILTRAFRSTSDDILDAACGALAAFGDMAWESIDMAKTNVQLFLTPEFGSAALQSLGRPVAKWSRRNDRALSRWLAASIRSDTVLATTLDEKMITSLFISRVSGMLEEENPVGDRGTMWNIAYMFLKW